MWLRLSMLAPALRTPVPRDSPVRGSRDPGARRTRARAVVSYPMGLAVEGPGYRVWDEDPRFAREWADELRDELRGREAARPGPSGGPRP
jgi:hypothetical protein